MGVVFVKVCCPVGYCKRGSSLFSFFCVGLLRESHKAGGRDNEGMGCLAKKYRSLIPMKW